MGSIQFDRQWAESARHRHPGFAWRDVLAVAGMTQLQMAQAAKMSKKHVNQILQGVVLPSATVVLRMAKAVDDTRPEHKRDGGCSLARLMWQIQSAYVINSVIDTEPTG